MREIRLWLLNNERTFLRLKLERMDRIEAEVEKIETGSGIKNKLKRLHTLPLLRTELTELLEDAPKLQTRLVEVESKLRDLKNG